MSDRLFALAELGRLCRLDFAEPFLLTDASVLGGVKDQLEERVGDLQQVFNVLFNPDTETFSGRATQRISIGRSQTYEFEFNPDRMRYRLIDADQAAAFADTDEGFVAIADFAAAAVKAGKKLNCKPGNVQCGGKCQDGKKNCFAGMTAAQKKAAQTLAKQAAATAPTSTPAPAPAASPPSSPAAPTSPIRTNQTELDSKRGDLEKRFGVKAIANAEKNVQRILNDEDTGVYIRVGSSDTLEKVLGSQFRTSAELGIDTHQIPNLKGGYQAARNRVEEKTMGYALDTAPGDRPIYGYLGGRDLSGDSHANVSAAYGSIAVRLRPEAKERTTFTGADSFKSGIASEVVNPGTPPPPNAASLVATTRHGFDRDKLPAYYPSYLKSDAGDGTQLREAARAKNIDELVPKLATTGNAYMEAQVHGGVKPSDIAEIHFSPSGRGDKPTAAIAQFAKDNGVDLFVSGQKLSEQDLDSIISPVGDRRSQRLKDIADALERRDFNALTDQTNRLYEDAQSIRLNPGEDDAILKSLYAESGYDGLPKVGTRQDLDNAVTNGQTMMVRGMRPDPGDRTSYLEQFKTGDYHTGNGIYGNGTYVSHSGTYAKDGSFVQGNSSKDMQDAWKAVASRNSYITASTLNFRMALDKDAVVMTQRAMSREIKDTQAALLKWATAERVRIRASNPGFTRADVNRHKTEVSRLETDFNAGKPTYRKQQDMLGNDTYQVSIPSASSSNRISFAVEKDFFNRFNVTRSDGSTYEARTLKDAIAEGQRDYFRSEAARRLGFSEIPTLNGGAGGQQLTEFNERVRRTEEVLFGDLGEGSSGRYGVIRGVDAIALNDSYEPNRFMNLLNRTRVTVQDTPLDYKTGQRVGAGVR